MFKLGTLTLSLAMVLALLGCGSSSSGSDNATTTDDTVASTTVGTNSIYTLVDTGQESFYDAYGVKIEQPVEGEAFYGQDAEFTSVPFSFTDNGDGTITDNNTGLTWQKSPENRGLSWDEAVAYCEDLTLAGSSDWRIPSSKELFSLSNFSSGWPYIDMEYFDLAEGITKDEQYWSSDFYKVGTTHNGAASAFGVNHVTGHIKAYPSGVSGQFGNFVRCVKGDYYGINSFTDNGDGTITDSATGLMWMQDDTGEAVDWENALLTAENATYGGYSDWRLPNVKELQSIVDYSGNFPAIDKLFNCTPIVNEAGDDDYGYYWSSTSARFNKDGDYYYAWYVAFGHAVNDDGEDTHGAGAVRFDMKVEDGQLGEGGERYYNYVRLVRDVN